jgi:hypothetical protein
MMVMLMVRQVVSTAISINHDALKYASEDLRNDRDIVSEAIQLQYLSDLKYTLHT